MQDPLNAQLLLKTFGVVPKKDLGQNFIVRRTALDQVIAAASLEDQDLILEIGAGLGALTLELARQSREVFAVEYDARLIPILHKILEGLSNVSIIHGDILQLDLTEILGQRRYKIVANIPYQITSLLIRRLMESQSPAQRVVLTIQREVAERIVAKPGDLSLLALSVQVFGQPKIHSYIPAAAFYPQPKVDSSVLTIDMFAQPQIDADEIDQFFRIVKAGFSQKRKQLRNALSGGLRVSSQVAEEIMHGANLSPSRRAQELDLSEWQRLFESFNARQKN